MTHPHPFATRTRMLVVVAGWLALAAMQAMLLASAVNGLRRLDAVFALYGALALTWALMTPAIGAIVQSAWMRRARLPSALLVHGLLLLAAGAMDTTVRRTIVAALGGSAVITWPGTLLYYADRTFVSYLLVVMVARTLASHDLFVRRQRHALALQAQVARARLMTLEQQLHPHFLFNTLGAVTELTHEAPARAARMLRQLASVLSFALERRTAEVTLREELDALEPYLELQRTRFADWLSIEVEIPAAAGGFLLPPLIVQPLVENSIRHGLSRRMAAGQILITAQPVGDTLVIQVRDNGVGLGPRALEGRGIGLSNVRERLASLYGDDASVRLYHDAMGETAAEVSLPLRTVREAPASDELVRLRDHALDDAPMLPAFLRGHRALVIVAAWGAWGLLWTQQSVAYLAFRGRLAEQGVLDIALRDFLTSMLWALLTPLMLLCARHIPFERSLIALRLAAHAAAAVAIAILHGVLTSVLVHRTAVQVFTADGIASIMWGVLAYTIVVTIAHHATIREWLRERELASARLRVGLAEAELGAATARGRPRELLDRLETIAQSVLRDPRSADTELARLGDRLRAALDARIPA